MSCSVRSFIVFCCVLFVCKCVLYYCHRVSTQLQLAITLLYHITVSYQMVASQEELRSMESVKQVKKPKLWAVFSLLSIRSVGRVAQSV